jgi:pilus assembly protein Flp/PilA
MCRSADGQPTARRRGTCANNQKEIAMLTQLKKLWKDEEGATAVEYGLMVAAIAAVIVTVVVSIGNKINIKFNDVDKAL